MLTAVICAAYLMSMVLANVLVAVLGPWFSPINSFVLIGFDLVARDWLQMRLRPLHLLALIVAGALITLLVSPGAWRVALASSCAFSLAALADWAAFSRLRNQRWMVRSNGSNVAGALVDSVAFPTIAFGVFMPGVVALQFLAKVSGGAAWSALLRRRG